MEARKGVSRTSSGYRSLRQILSYTSDASVQVHDVFTTRTPLTFYLFFLVFVATLGPFQFGYHLGELNTPGNVITCKLKRIPTAATVSPDSSFLPQCIPMTTAQWGTVQSIFTIGGLCGSLITGKIATYFGRLPAMMALTSTLAAGSVIETFAFSISMLSFGRFISGIGAGAATVVCPIYISELSPMERRGLFGALSQVMINAGILIAQVLGYFFSRDSLWRVILAFPGFVSCFALLALCFAPETPTWLIDKGDMQGARRVLHKLRGADVDIRKEMQYHTSSNDEDEARSLLKDQRSTSPENQISMTFIEVVRMPKYRKAVVAVSITFMAQQLTGINSVVMYSVAILGNIVPSGAALITVMVSAVNVGVSVLCTPLPDKIGRKGCLLLSITGMGTSSAMLALGLSQDMAILTVTALVTFVASFGMGLGPVPFILVSEVVGPEAVGALSSWALAGNWISTFCVAQFFPLLNKTIPGGKVFCVFAGLAFLFGLLITWLLPETKRKRGLDEVWDGPGKAVP